MIIDVGSKFLPFSRIYKKTKKVSCLVKDPSTTPRILHLARSGDITPLIDLLKSFPMYQQDIVLLVRPE